MFKRLFRKQSPIFVEEWLEPIRSSGGDGRKKCILLLKVMQNLFEL